jgi:hypothetical protein
MKVIQVIRDDKYETLESYKETIRYMIYTRTLRTLPEPEHSSLSLTHNETILLLHLESGEECSLVVCVRVGVSPSSYNSTKGRFGGIFLGYAHTTAWGGSLGGATWKLGVRGAERGSIDPWGRPTLVGTSP